MSRRSLCLPVLVCLVLAAAGGCTPQQPFYLGDDGDLSHYKAVATELEVPDVDVRSSDEVCGASTPLSLGNSDARPFWNLTLEEAMRDALANSKVMRNLGVSLGSPDSLTRAADAVATVWDPARVESNPRFGTEAALSAFDAQFTTSLYWEKVDKPVNVGSTGSLFMASVDQQDLGTFQAQLAKTNAVGGTTAIGYNVYYDQSNSPLRQWPSDWNTDVTAEFRQPLFQGYGVQFNRIAGPGAIPGYNNGVIIARIQNDIALADFENSVRTFVRDVESAYWSLYLAYRELDAVKAGQESALQTWRKIKNLQEQGARGGEAEKEAQAREQYWLFVSQAQQRQSDVFAAEAQLRYMMGLAVADGRQIRPADEPTGAKVSFDWNETMCEAMVRNIDLRRQKWRVKEKEMELISAKNYLLPKIDAVGQYRWRGLGDDYWYTSRTGAEFDTSMQNLTGGDYQDWQFGLEANIPIGFRKQMAGVRYAQLNIARERELLREQELEVSHQLGAAIRDLEQGVQLVQTNYNYYLAAKHELAAVQAAYDSGTITFDVLLTAQRRVAEAEIAYYRALVNYNLAIVDIHYRKGSLLEYNGIWLAEGPWAGKAYFDARRRAQARDAGLYIDYGFTQPKVISQGPYNQQVGQGVAAPMGPIESVDGVPVDQSQPEEILAPAPEGPVAPPAAESSQSTGASEVGPKLTEAVSAPSGRLAETAPKTTTASRGDSQVRLASAQIESTTAARGVKAAAATAPASTWKRASRTGANAQTSDAAAWRGSNSRSTSASNASLAAGWTSAQR